MKNKLNSSEVVIGSSVRVSLPSADVCTHRGWYWVRICEFSETEGPVCLWCKFQIRKKPSVFANQRWSRGWRKAWLHHRRTNVLQESWPHNSTVLTGPNRRRTHSESEWNKCALKLREQKPARLENPCIPVLSLLSQTPEKENNRHHHFHFPTSVTPKPRWSRDH